MRALAPTNAAPRRNGGEIATLCRSSAKLIRFTVDYQLVQTDNAVKIYKRQ
jgi:hypothetical protein